ncbi:hydrogenase-4 component G [Sulfurospirillum sp.]|nr:hydrogenase-4 component G [Sulfurospirillum sp.]
MNIDNSFASNAYQDIATNVKKKIEETKDLTAKDISNQYLVEYQMKIISESKTETFQQADVLSLTDIGYEGKPIAELTQAEAKELVNEDGFFGITQTSERISNFVLMGAGDDADKLKAGREGILRGFKEAESMWGGKLPDISYETIDKAVEMIDKKLGSLRVSILDSNA